MSVCRLGFAEPSMGYCHSEIQAYNRKRELSLWMGACLQRAALSVESEETEG